MTCTYCAKQKYQQWKRFYHFSPIKELLLAWLSKSQCIKQKLYMDLSWFTISWHFQNTLLILQGLVWSEIKRKNNIDFKFQSLSTNGHVRIISTHCWRLGSPACWTHLTVGFHKLESLHKTKGLFNTTTHWQVIYAHVLHHTIWIDDEQTPKRKVAGKF